MKVLFTGGGTGGHIFPIIAICREIRRLRPNRHPNRPLQFYYVGPKDRFGKILLSKEGIKVKTVFSGKIRRYLGWKSLLLNIGDILFKIPLGLIQGFFLIFFLFPDLIFSKGGYGSLPAVIGGWIFGCPIFLHESDLAPGLSNRIVSRFASKIFVSFPKTEYFPPKKMEVVGNPIRTEILKGNKKEGKRIFNLTEEKPVILILGGSQGAQKINDTILNILPEILKDFELIHQCGEKNFSRVKTGFQIMISKEMRKYYHLVPFFKEPQLKHAYASSDLVVSRAGSGIIFEISALEKPSILIPLPLAAQNHQLKNAYAYAREGAAIVLEEVNLTPHFFLERIKSLFSYPEELKKMSQAAKQFSKPEAAKTIAKYILNYLSK